MCLFLSMQVSPDHCLNVEPIYEHGKEIKNARTQKKRERKGLVVNNQGNFFASRPYRTPNPSSYMHACTDDGRRISPLFYFRRIPSSHRELIMTSEKWLRKCDYSRKGRPCFVVCLD